MDNDGWKIWWKDRSEVWIKDPTRVIFPPPNESKLIRDRLEIGREIRKDDKKDKIISITIIWIIIWVIWMMVNLSIWMLT